MRKLSGLIVVVLLVIGLLLTSLYHIRNLETEELDATVRQQVQGQFVELSHGSTHFELAGPDTGQVVILVHGFSVPYYIWDGTFETLVESGFRVLRYDLFGRGYSDRPDVVYDSVLYEQQLLDLMAKLHLKAPVSLAGLSVGGGIVMSFVAHHPDKVRRIVLVDPLHARVAAPSGPEWLVRYRTAILDAYDMADSQLTDFYHPELFPDWPDRYRVQMRYSGFQRALVSTRYHFMPENHQENYRRVNETGKPVLLIWGKEDQTLPFAGSSLVRDLVNVEFMPVDDAGHLPHLEKPELVNARIVSFLKGKH